MNKFLFLFIITITTIFANDSYKELEHKQTYLSSITECKKLGSEWRLPEIWELFTLKGETKTFGKDKRYWSKTSLQEKRILDTHMASDEFFIRNVDIPAFAFYLQDGDVTPTPKSPKAFVLCPNTPIKPPSEKDFLKDKKQGVKDLLNNILWEPLTKENRTNKLSFEEAEESCEDKSLYEISWRLPSLDELYSIVNYDYVKPSLNTEIFSNMQKKYYWSEDEFKEEGAYVVGFSIGSIATSPKSNKSYFRCVSDLED